MDASEQHLIRVAEYLRMSTDMQQYSIACQQEAIRHYAETHNLDIVRTYVDEGKSGLRLQSRAGLIQLLPDIQERRADFKMVLVYDVSRWGRFQDTDESAYYEYLCRKANIDIAYCAEPFENDGGPLSTILKGVKRAMAAEFSRELAVRVSAAKLQGVMAGNHQGGKPAFAFQRMLVDSSGKHKGLLPSGISKSIKTERTVLVPGPAREIKLVKRIFELYVNDCLSTTEIAARLNARGSLERPGMLWTSRRLREILANESYAGTLVYNRWTSLLLEGRKDVGKRRAPRAHWVRQPLGFPGYVSQEVFNAARLRARRFGIRYQRTDALLTHLRSLLETHGYLDTDLINSVEGGPSAPVYHRHFRSLRKAYALIGYVQERDWGSSVLSGERLAAATAVVERLREAVLQFGGNAVWHPHYRVLTIDDRLSVAVLVARCEMLRRDGGLRWKAHT